MINRRQILQRDPPVNWGRIISELRASGWGTSEMCFVLNITRGALWHWENDDQPNPPYEDGRALLKLHASCITMRVVSRPPAGTFLMNLA